MQTQELLALAAKARIRRMIQPKIRRTDLNVPDFVKKHWDSGTKAKDELAQMLKDANFEREALMQMLLVCVCVCVCAFAIVRACAV